MPLGNLEEVSIQRLSFLNTQSDTFDETLQDLLKSGPDRIVTRTKIRNSKYFFVVLLVFNSNTLPFGYILSLDLGLPSQIIAL